MRIKNHTLTAYALAFLLLLLAGGGGGSSSSTPATMTPDGDDATPEASVDLGDLMIPAGDYTIDAGMTQDVGEGEDEVTLSCSAATDCAFTVADDGTAMATTGVVTAALSDAAMMARTDARTAQAKADAERIAGLIGPKPKLADADLSSAASNESIVSLSVPPTDDNYSMPMFQTVAADGTATTVMFTASEDMPAMIDGWTGGTYTHTSEDGNTMHTVVKYNDKAADRDEAYSTFFSEANTESTTDPGPHRASIAVESVSTATDSEGDTVVTGILNIDEADIAGNHGLFTGTAIPGADNSTTTHTGAQSVTGMFRGVPGTFKCPSACTSTKDKDGNLSGLGGEWTFVPTDVDGLDATDATEGGGIAKIVTALKALMVSGTKQDADYLIFGYWEQSVTDDDGETAETMLPFADGKRDYGTVADVAGTATYSGSATGLYMKKTLTSSGLVNPEGPWASGQFTADAMLMATFGGDSVAEDNKFSITGTISNFMDGDTAIDENWKVGLNRRMLAGADTVLGNDDDTLQKNMYGSDSTIDGDGSEGIFGGVTHGGMLHDGENVGSWSGTFHGAADAEDDSPMPASVSGIFDAHLTNGHIRGAFGANKD